MTQAETFGCRPTWPPGW